MIVVTRPRDLPLESWKGWNLCSQAYIQAQREAEREAQQKAEFGWVCYHVASGEYCWTEHKPEGEIEDIKLATAFEKTFFNLFGNTTKNIHKYFPEFKGIGVLRAYTDYPFEELGDIPQKLAPIRQVILLSYDGDKYVTVKFNEIIKEIKSGYLYEQKGRFEKARQINMEIIHSLPNTLDEKEERNE